jgi:hypothetical protein
MGHFLPGNALEKRQQIPGIVPGAAVHHQNFVVLRADDVALHIVMGGVSHQVKSILSHSSLLRFVFLNIAQLSADDNEILEKRVAFPAVLR